MRLIDADDFKNYLEKIRQEMLEEDTMSSNFAAEVIETAQDEYLQNAPTVDAVEVVRCKDCKKWLKVEPSGTNCRVCAVTTRSRLPFDFCSYGERRNDG